MTTLAFWFEFGSTYTYPAAMRIEQAARGANVELAWKPFLLGPIFKAQGWDTSPFNLYPAKGAYMWRDLERICEAQGLPLKRPGTFPRVSLPAARLACAYSDAPWLPEFVRRVYRANFAEDRNISDPQVIGEILAEAGQPRELVAAAEAPQAKQRLRANTEEAQRRGIFGAPSFTVGDELFWGNDRLEQALAWARR